jgi:hypothetical protein
MPTDWKEIVANGDLVICSELEARRLNIYPNRYAHPRGRPRVGALVIFEESNGMFRHMLDADDFIEAKLRAGDFESAVLLSMRQHPNGRVELIAVHSFTAIKEKLDPRDIHEAGCQCEICIRSPIDPPRTAAIATIQSLKTVIERRGLKPINGDYQITEEIMAEAIALDRANGEVARDPEQTKH